MEYSHLQFFLQLSCKFKYFSRKVQKLKNQKKVVVSNKALALLHLLFIILQYISNKTASACC